MRRNDKVCVIIPAYNEARVIRGVVKKTSASIKQLFPHCEIVVVDDCSSDNTALEARSAGATVIKHLLNMGAGGATSTGMLYAQKQGFDIAVTLDADGQHDPEDAKRGISIALEQKTDLLIGSRLINSDGMSSAKQVGNRGLSFLTFILYGVMSTDSQSGLRVFSRRSIDTLRWKSTRYEFCSEMLWRAKQLGLVIDEYPIRAIYTDYSRAKGQSNWNALNLVRNMAKNRIMELLSE